MVERKVFEARRAPGFLFSALDKVYDLALTKRMKAAGVTAIQWSLLDQLYQHEGINQRELARYCMKDPSSLTKTVDILEKKALLVRKQDERDRRAFNLFLTDEGRQVRQQAYEIASGFYEQATEGVSEESLEQFYEISMVIWDNINALEEDGE